ncbi:MAG: CHAT domain-containing tetratricopeptide repeat protein [Aulosira sp. DedQUE10]|nr:CHAT domain-containing tetratricopeptide repeat protein [Aulosira sp. DedQUE10]
MLCRLKLFSLATLVFLITFPARATELSNDISRATSSTLTVKKPSIKIVKSELENFYELSVQLFHQNKLTEALRNFTLVLELAKLSNDRLLEAKTLNYIGLVHYNQKQYDKALEFYQQALVIYQKVDDKNSQATVLYNIAEVYRQQEKYPQALKFYGQALAFYKQAGNRTWEGVTFNNTGLVYYNQKQYSQALKFYNLALVIHKEVDNKAGEGTTLNNIGLVYNKQQNYPQALDYYRQALIIYQQLNNKAKQANTLKYIGEVYQNQYQYDDAVKSFEGALAIFQQINQKKSQFSILINLGNINKEIGKYAKALQYYEQALTIAKTLENQKERIESEFVAHGYTAILKQELGQNIQMSDFVPQPVSPISKDEQDDFDRGLYFNQQVDVIAKEVETNGTDIKGLSNYANERLKSYSQDLENATKQGKSPATYILYNIGKFHNSIGKYPQAQQFYQQALTANLRTNDKKEQGELLNYIGVTYYNQGEYTKALKYFQQSATIRQSIADKTGEGFALNNMGATYSALGEYVNAEKTLFEAINIFESMRPGLTDNQKVSIFETYAKAYRRLQKALVAQNKNDSALEVAERGRARAFIELLASKQLEKPNPQLDIKPLTLQQIKNIAKVQNATLVQYSTLGNALYIWVVKPTGEIVFQQVDLKKSLNTPLRDLVTLSRKSIGVSERGGIIPKPIAEANNTKQLQKLHEILIKPIATHLPTDPNAHVIFIPQESLFLVPFPALQDEEGKYLIDKHTILTAPAIQVLELTHQQRVKSRESGVESREVLVVGNPTMPKIPITNEKLIPLPGAELEAIQIADLFKIPAIIGSKATKTTIVQKMIKARIIHFATHALLDDLKGFGVPGAIALAPDSQGGDGFLTASEILSMKLNAELVVLSACNTGGGNITGDGVIGLSRSLITAGVPSVIVSLWSVDDKSTASLMSGFYRNLQHNPDKAVALRIAMLTTKKQYSNPLDWAAFTLIGEAY